MKSFIKSKLRVLLESDIKTVSNPMSGNEKHSATYNDLRVITAKVSSVQKQFGSDKYFQDAREGDGVYLIIISKNGRVTVKTPNRQISDREIGGVTTTRVFDNIEVPIKAYSGNDELLQKGRGQVTGQPKTESGASDARIKAYVIFGDMIIDRVKQNVEGAYDKYTGDDNTFQGNNEKQINRKEFINQREKEREFRQKTKAPLSLPDDEENAILQRQAQLQAKYEKMKAQKRGY
jgi:hypothetical protein